MRKWHMTLPAGMSISAVPGSSAVALVLCDDKHGQVDAVELAEDSDVMVNAALDRLDAAAARFESRRTAAEETRSEDYVRARADCAASCALLTLSDRPVGSGRASSTRRERVWTRLSPRTYLVRAWTARRSRARTSNSPRS